MESGGLKADKMTEWELFILPPPASPDSRKMDPCKGLEPHTVSQSEGIREEPPSSSCFLPAVFSSHVSMFEAEKYQILCVSIKSTDFEGTTNLSECCTSS